MTIHSWKVPHLVKGTLTRVPFLAAWRLRQGSTGGSSSTRYCYGVWLRHMVLLGRHGFDVRDAQIGELGPGDSIGTGLAALLSGASRYVGLDLVPFSAKADLAGIVRELERLYRVQAPIPNHDEFPAVRPRLASYEFPLDLVDTSGVSQRAELAIADVAHALNLGPRIGYIAPWTSVNAIAPASLDLIFSQAVLQFVDGLEALYRAMFTWTKPGGYGSHSIGCSAMYLSPYWNGHWAYSDLEWRIVRGRRAYLHNREPASVHVSLARRAGFEVLSVERDQASDGLPKSALASRFRALGDEDLNTRGMVLILRRPRGSQEKATLL